MSKTSEEKAKANIKELKKIVYIKKEKDYWDEVLILTEKLKNYFSKLRMQVRNMKKAEKELDAAEIKKITDDSVDVDKSEKALDKIKKEVASTEKSISDIGEKIKKSPAKELFNFLQ